MGAQKLLAEARQLFTAGRPQQAEELLQKVLAQNPRETQAMAALGVIAAETGRRDLALRWMSQVLALDPNFVPALVWVSLLMSESGQLEPATRHAAKAAQLAPGNPAPHTALARCLAKQGKNIEAIPSFKKAIELNPNNPPLLYDYADALIAMGMEREATTALQKAVAMAPDTRGELKLAYLELGLGRIDEAEKFCKRALVKEPNLSSAHVLMGRIYTEQLRLNDAEDHWEQAAELNPKPGAISLEKALSLNAIGHFDAAIDELARSIEAKPVQGAAYQALVFAKRMTSSDQLLVEQMERILPHDSLTDSERLNLLYSLGKSFDNLGEYEKAISYFDRANHLKGVMLGLSVFDKAAFTAYIDSRIKTFSKEHLAEWKPLGTESSLPIMIVGMMRSGTTLAEQMLSCHPKVGGAGEQHYWGDHEPAMVDFARQTIDKAQIRSCASDFVALLSSIAPGFPHVIDKNPANLQVVGSLHVALPNARIIHTRRNAIDTAISIWTTPMRTNAPFISDRENIVFAYKEYLRLMAHWREVLPADRFLEVHYEDLVDQPETFARQMLAFCGLEWDEAVLHPELNKRRIKTPSLWQARQPVYRSSTERWKKYEPWLGAFEQLRGLS